MTQNPDDTENERRGQREDEDARKQGLEERIEAQASAVALTLKPLSGKERKHIRDHYGTLSTERKALEALECLEAEYVKITDEVLRECDRSEALSAELEKTRAELKEEKDAKYADAKSAELQAVHADLGDHVDRVTALEERVACTEKERDEAIAAKFAAHTAHQQRGVQLGEQIRLLKRERDVAYDMLAKERADSIEKQAKLKIQIDEWRERDVDDVGLLIKAKDQLMDAASALWDAATGRNKVTDSKRRGDEAHGVAIKLIERLGE